MTAPLSTASLRLRALSTLSGSLTDALTPAVAADLVERQALGALGATSAVVVTLGAFPPPPGDRPAVPAAEARLHVVHAVGGDVAVRAALSASVESQGLDAPVPFAEVARTGEPMFLAVDAIEERFAEWGAGLRRAGVQSLAVVPVWANGELRGVLGLTWADDHAFDEDERAFVTTLGVMCAQAIMRAYLKVAEREARERAERANRAKAEFVANVSHELRSPISAVMNYAQVIAQLSESADDANAKHRISRMQASGKHLMALIDDLLDQARIDSGADVVHAERVDLPALLQASAALVRPLADSAGMDLQLDLGQAPVWLVTDATKVSRIVVNLLSNAIKYAPMGVVHVVLDTRSVARAARVHISVSDTGAGMSAEERAHCFDPFWQKATLEGAPRSGGAGLGLSIARQLARQLGGELTVLDTGALPSSTFILTLPLMYVAGEARAPEG